MAVRSSSVCYAVYEGDGQVRRSWMGVDGGRLAIRSLKAKVDGYGVCQSSRGESFGLMDRAKKLSRLAQVIML